MLNINKLKAKGWSDYEIHHALEILTQAEQEKHPRIKRLDENLFWFFIVIAILGNLAFSIALIPFLISFQTVFTYIITAFTGFVFGTLCTTLFRSIERIERRHHILYSVIIIIAGKVNFVLMTLQSNAMVEAWSLGNLHNPYILGICYLIFFFLPYILLFRKRENSWI